MRVGFNISMNPGYAQISPETVAAVYASFADPYMMMRREVSVSDYALCVNEGACIAPRFENEGGGSCTASLVLSETSCLPSMSAVKTAAHPDHHLGTQVLQRTAAGVRWRETTQDSAQSWGECRIDLRGLLSPSRVRGEQESHGAPEPPTTTRSS